MGSNMHPSTLDTGYRLLQLSIMQSDHTFCLLIPMREPPLSLSSYLPHVPCMLDENCTVYSVAFSQEGANEIRNKCRVAHDCMRVAVTYFPYYIVEFCQGGLRTAGVGLLSASPCIHTPDPSMQKMISQAC